MESRVDVVNEKVGRLKAKLDEIVEYGKEANKRHDAFKKEMKKARK